MDNFFQSSDKKVTMPYAETYENFQEFLRNRELNRTFLSLFSKGNFFLHFKTTTSF